MSSDNLEKLEKVFHVGSNLKKLRIYRDLSFDKMAVQMPINIETLKGYEGNSRIPALESLIKIARFFEVSLDFLILWEKTQYPHNLHFLELALKVEALSQINRFQVESVSSTLMKGQSNDSILYDKIKIELSNDIHQNIRILRTEKEVPQKALADLLKVQQGVISNYEKKINPSLEKIIKLSEYFGVSIHAFATGQKLAFQFIDGHFGKAMLQADQILTLDEHKMLIHLMQTMVDSVP